MLRLEAVWSKHAVFGAFPSDFLASERGPALACMNYNRILRDWEGQGGGGEALDYDSLLRSSMDELMEKTEAHQLTWGFGHEEEWQLDQDKGELVFKFPGRSAVTPVQIVGTYDKQTGSWMWAWANPLIADNLKTEALRLKQYGDEFGIQRLSAPEWLGDESDCWYMAALACRLANAQGAYRGPAADTYTFMTFGIPSHTPPPEDHVEILRSFKEETATEFRTCAEDWEAQRKVCCRYFRRGAVIGLSQSELIDALGLDMPSVLDIAGYPPESSERIMDLIGEISDDEIQNSCAASVS